MNDSELTQLYRHFDAAGVLLYVGISHGALQRLAAHQSTSPWYYRIATVTIETYRTRHQARTAELLAIRTEHPLYNVEGRASAIEPEELPLCLGPGGVVDRPLKLKEAAAYLGYPVRKLRSLCSEGLLGWRFPFKNGRHSHWRILPEQANHIRKFGLRDYLRCVRSPRPDPPQIGGRFVDLQLVRRHGVAAFPSPPASGT